MFTSVGFVGVTRVFVILAQTLIVYLLSRNYTPEDLGIYMLLVSISLPAVNCLLMDVPTKVLTGTVKSKNILEIIGSILFVAILLLLATICFQLTGLRSVSAFMTLLCAVFFMKAGQAVLEVEMAELKKEEHFEDLFWLIIKSQLSVYLLMAFVMLKPFDLVFVYTAGAIASCGSAALSLSRLADKGWLVERCSPFAYIKSEFHLGVAIGFKSLSSNLLRYVAVLVYGITSFGYMAPAFYSLTIFSNLGIIVDNVVTPRVLKRLDTNEPDFTIFKAELLFVSTLSGVVLFGAYLFADTFYELFFPDKSNQYSEMIIIFASGYFFYVLRAVIRVVSFKLGLAVWQVTLQLIFAAVLILSILVMRGFVGVNGLAFSYVFATIFICFVYLAIIYRHLSINAPSSVL